MESKSRTCAEAYIIWSFLLPPLGGRIWSFLLPPLDGRGTASRVGGLSRSVIESAVASAATAEGSGQVGWRSRFLSPRTGTKADADTQTNADSFFRVLHETKNIAEKP